jgi:hypothetical protein
MQGLEDANENKSVKSIQKTALWLPNENGMMRTTGEPLSSTYEYFRLIHYNYMTICDGTSMSRHNPSEPLTDVNG